MPEWSRQHQTGRHRGWRRSLLVRMTVNALSIWSVWGSESLLGGDCVLEYILEAVWFPELSFLDCLVLKEVQTSSDLSPCLVLVTEVVNWIVVMVEVVEYSSDPLYGLVDIVEVVVMVVQSSAPQSSWLKNKVLVSETCYYSQLFPLQMFWELVTCTLKGIPCSPLRILVSFNSTTTLTHESMYR